MLALSERMAYCVEFDRTGKGICVSAPENGHLQN